jgi:parallel beta-helix repeat protein
VKGNTIRKWYTAIDFPYSVNNVTIINNTISDNGDGVIIQGWINDFTFNKNLVTGNSRVGVLFDYDFMGTKGNFTLENNFFSYNGVLDLQNKGDKAVSIGKNFAKNRCYRVGMKYGFNIRSRQSGSKYYFSVVDRYGNAVSGLPNFSAVLTVNGRSYTVNFINSVAYLDIGSGAGGKGSSSSSLNVGEDNRQFSQWGQFDQVDSEEMDYYEQLYKELLKSLSSNSQSSSNSDSQSNPSQGNPQNQSGSGDSGSSSGDYSINSNGVLSGSSGSAGVSASSSAGPAPSSDVPESASAKTLSIDDETFRVIGVGGLVLLIILVIGLYYREDIMEMMKE